MSARDNAVHLLDHYITLLMTRAGLKPDRDTHAELAECIDHVIDAAVEATTRALEERGKITP